MKSKRKSEIIADALLPLILKWDDKKAIDPRKYIINLIESEFVREVELEKCLEKTLRELDSDAGSDIWHIDDVVKRAIRRIQRTLGKGK